MVLRYTSLEVPALDMKVLALGNKVHYSLKYTIEKKYQHLALFTDKQVALTNFLKI